MTTNPTLIDPENDHAVKELVESTSGLHNLTLPAVKNADEYSMTASALAAIKSRQSALEELRRSFTQPLDALKRRWMDFFRVPEERLVRAEAEHKRVLRVYDDEQREAARRKQAELDAAAQRERERIARQREAAERTANAKLAELRRKRELAEQAGKTAEAERLRTREQGIEEASATKVEALEAAASMVVSAVATVAVPKVGGLTYRTVWLHEIIDKAKVPEQFKTVDETAIRGVVRALKDKADIPGVRIYSERQVASGRSQ